MPKQVTAYQCEYCAMTSATKASVTRHEKKSCRENPNRRSCHTCKHSGTAWEGVDFPGEESFDVIVLTCAVESVYFVSERIDRCPSYEQEKPQ